MLFFQLLEVPALGPILLGFLVITIRRNYFGRPLLKFYLEICAGIGIGASILSILLTTRFNAPLLTLKVANNPAGWYLFTFVELFGVIGLITYRFKSPLMGILYAWTVVGLHEVIWLLGQGAGITGYFNFEEVYWASIVFPVPFVIPLVMKVNWKIYLAPMLVYLILGLIAPWFFSPTHNDTIGWTLTCVCVCLGLQPKLFSATKDMIAAVNKETQVI